MVSSWTMIFSMGYIHVCISNKTYMEKPLCLIAYAKSLRKNNLAWFISAFACGFARLRAPAKHRRNAFAAKVGTALLTKSLHPKKKRCSNGCWIIVEHPIEIVDLGVLPFHLLGETQFLAEGSRKWTGPGWCSLCSSKRAWSLRTHDACFWRVKPFEKPRGFKLRLF